MYFKAFPLKILNILLIINVFVNLCKIKIVIGGFDFLVYKGLDMTSDEVVIYWYLHFDS